MRCGACRFEDDGRPGPALTTVLSSAAVADLENIARFIALDNPARAVSFVEELREAARRLADLTLGFPLVPRYERHGIRRRSWNGYASSIPLCPTGYSSIASSVRGRITIAR